jgi:hypothetical protein
MELFFDLDSNNIKMRGLKPGYCDTHLRSMIHIDPSMILFFNPNPSLKDNTCISKSSIIIYRLAQF